MHKVRWPKIIVITKLIKLFVFTINYGIYNIKQEQKKFLKIIMESLIRKFFFMEQHRLVQKELVKEILIIVFSQMVCMDMEPILQMYLQNLINLLQLEVMVLEICFLLKY